MFAALLISNLPNLTVNILYHKATLIIFAIFRERIHFDKCVNTQFL